MATEPMLAALDGSLRSRSRVRRSSALADYWALTKPEVNFLIVITTFAGFYLGSGAGWQGFSLSRAINAVFGTLLVASGTGTLNQYIERVFDAQMRRTARRPLAAGRLNPSAVLWFGTALSILGGIYLALTVNPLASALAIATLLSYLFLYTPLKRKTPLCTLVGAFPGAMPPLIGWAAASGRLNFEAWMLYAVVFFWQFPHFMAIAWMYREDYARAGYHVLPSGSQGRITLVSRQTLLPLFALLAVTLFLTSPGPQSFAYSIGACLLTVGFFYYGALFVVRRSNSAARRLLAASILYLPTMFFLVILSRN
jgi:protoheme IX farnesyltransferase